MRRFFFRLTQLGLLFVLSIFAGLVLIALSTKFTLKLEQKSFGHQTHWGSSWERITEFETWAAKNKTSKAVQKQATARGLIIGSSTAYRNLNPHIFSEQTGVDWFNYGSSGQSPSTSLLLLQHAFERCKIKYVLFDIYGPVVQLEGLESAHDLIYNSKLNFWLKTKLVCSFPEGKLWLRYLYFYTKQVLPSKPYIIQDPNNGTYLKKGFVCSNQAALINYKARPKPQKMPTFPELAQIAALCKANGARLILNISPSLKGPFHLPQAFKKYPLIYNKSFHNPAHFYDTHHMTCEGANLYSEGVSMKLKSILN